MIRVRPALDRIPTYVPGKSAESVANEHRLGTAIKLASNEVPYPPTQKVLDAITEAARERAPLPRRQQQRAPRRRSRRATACDDDEVLVAGGSVTMCGQFILATCDAGDEVVYSWPSFEAYPILTMQVGATGPHRAAARRDLRPRRDGRPRR